VPARESQSVRAEPDTSLSDSGHGARPVNPNQNGVRRSNRHGLICPSR